MTGIFRSGQRKLVKLAVASATVIAKDDMVQLQSSPDQILAAAGTTWNSSLAQTQADFADRFAGIAYEKSANGDTDNVSVDVSSDSVYQFTVNSAAYEFGDPLGPDKDTGNALLSQTLEAAVAASSIARAAEDQSSAVTLLRVTFASAFWLSGGNANASLG